jgi:hypothetical protein
MTNVEKVSKMLDALADHRGVTLTAAQKKEVALQFIGIEPEDLQDDDPPPPDGEEDTRITTEVVAGHFLDQVITNIRRVGRAYVLRLREERLRDDTQAELDSAAISFTPPPET